MTGLAARVSRWLVRREPLWVVTGAGAVLDVVIRLVPAVPDSWHPYVTAVVAVLTLLSGRAIVSSPDTVARLRERLPFAAGGTVTVSTPILEEGPPGLVVPKAAGPSNLRRVNAAGHGGHPTGSGATEPTTGPQTPSGVSSANPQPADQPPSTP